MYKQGITEARSRNHCWRGKKYVLHNLSVCLKPYVSSMQTSSLCSLLHRSQQPAVLHCILGTLSYKRHEFRRRFIEYKMCVPMFCTVLCETFLTLRRIQAGVIIRLKSLSCILLVFSSECIHTLICRQIFEVLEYTNL